MQRIVQQMMALQALVLPWRSLIPWRIIPQGEPGQKGASIRGLVSCGLSALLLSHGLGEFFFLSPSYHSLASKGQLDEKEERYVITSWSVVGVIS